LETNHAGVGDRAVFALLQPQSVQAEVYTNVKARIFNAKSLLSAKLTASEFVGYFNST